MSELERKKMSEIPIGSIFIKELGALFYVIKISKQTKTLTWYNFIFIRKKINNFDLDANIGKDNSLSGSYFGNGYISVESGSNDIKERAIKFIFEMGKSK